jgi:hypothetical protein
VARETDPGSTRPAQRAARTRGPGRSPARCRHCRCCPGRPARGARRGPGAGRRAGARVSRPGGGRVAAHRRVGAGRQGSRSPGAVRLDRGGRPRPFPGHRRRCGRLRDTPDGGGSPIHGHLLRAGRRHEPVAAVDLGDDRSGVSGPDLEPVPQSRQPWLAGRGDRNRRGAGGHGSRRTGAADQPCLHDRHDHPGSPLDARAGATRSGGPGAGRRRVPGQDRDADGRGGAFRPAGALPEF